MVFKAVTSKTITWGRRPRRGPRPRPGGVSAFRNGASHHLIRQMWSLDLLLWDPKRCISPLPTSFPSHCRGREGSRERRVGEGRKPEWAGNPGHHLVLPGGPSPEIRIHPGLDRIPDVRSFIQQTFPEPLLCARHGLPTMKVDTVPGFREPLS